MPKSKVTLSCRLFEHFTSRFDEGNNDPEVGILTCQGVLQFSYHCRIHGLGALNLNDGFTYLTRFKRFKKFMIPSISLLANFVSDGVASALRNTKSEIKKWFYQLVFLDE